MNFLKFNCKIMLGEFYIRRGNFRRGLPVLSIVICLDNWRYAIWWWCKIWLWYVLYTRIWECKTSQLFTNVCRHELSNGWADPINQQKTVLLSYRRGAPLFQIHFCTYLANKNTNHKSYVHLWKSQLSTNYKQNIM